MNKIDNIENMIAQSIRLTSDMNGKNEVSVIRNVNLMFGVLLGAVAVVVLYEFVLTPTSLEILLLRISGFIAVFGLILFYFADKSADKFVTMRAFNIVDAWVERYLLDPVETPSFSIDPEHILKFNGKTFSTLTQEQRVYLIYLLKLRLITFKDVFGDSYNKQLTMYSKDPSACLKYLNDSTHPIAVSSKDLKLRILRLKNIVLRRQKAETS